MVKFLGAIPINFKGNTRESEDMIDKKIDWNKKPKKRDGSCSDGVTKRSDDVTKRSDGIRVSRPEETFGRFDGLTMSQTILYRVDGDDLYEICDELWFIVINNSFWKIMPPRMRTRSVGRPAAESLGGGTGVRVGRGGRGRRPREGNDECVNDLNSQGNDQGMRANGGVERVNENVEGANRGAPDFSTIIAQQLQNLLSTMLAQVIEFSDSYVAPQEELDTGLTSKSFAKKKGRTVAVTTKDMQKRRNDVKARTTLLLALPDEHQLRFSKYKTAQELWGAILKTFGGNEATKKTKKNQLKQQYGNFKAEGSESLEQTFNRLSAIRNRCDLDTMSLDDLYNHLKVYEPKVQKKPESNSQNMAFISSAKYSSGKGEVNTASIPTASTHVSPASTDVAAASISLDTICAYIASQSNGSQIKYKDINQIDEDDIEEIDIKWNMALLTNEEENYVLVADEEAPTEFTLMAKSSSSLENEVFNNSLGSKACKKNTDSLNTKITELSEKLSDTKTNLYYYKLGLSQVEARLVKFKTQEIKFCEKIRGLEFDLKNKNIKIRNLTNELEQIKKEKEGLDSKLTGFEFASKALDTLLGSQRSDKNKEGLGYSTVPPSCSTDSPTVIKTNKVETVRKPSVKYAEMYRNTTKSPKTQVSNGLGPQRELILFLYVQGNFENIIDDKGYWDSGCSWHMTGNISYLFYYEPYDGGYVSFGQGGGKITGKGIIKTGKLEFENVYFVKDLKYNLFSVSQIYDNKNSVLFTDSECIMLGRDFKLKDDTNVLLRTPRQHNMYSINLNNIVPHKDLTCLVAKASADESMLWHRRLGHLNFKTMNKLVRHNLVKGYHPNVLSMTILVLLA
nr:ribonuclease H-like domain-containing protein [Tanacetum cinerariifolium]